jgi:two-component system, OmpR family, phosphate regulon sensor histidine kinase PhoR
MGFAQWFWRLFLVFTGIIVAHVLIVNLLMVSQGGAAPAIQLWASALVVIAVGAAAIWYCVRRIVTPLAELATYARNSAGQTANPSDSLQRQDELSALTGAFEQMRRHLAAQLAQIQNNHERLQTVLSSMADGVLAVGLDNTILLANGAARQLLDFATPRPQGRSLLEVTRARPVHEAVARALANESPVVEEFESPGAIRRTLSLRATCLPGSPCPGVVIVLHDMTELRRLESLRRELVANVSHELKTPLAAIKGYAETLRLGAVHDPEHNLHFVRRIEEQADRLHQLILDILQIARVEAGLRSFELTDVPLADVLRDTVAQFAEIASAKQVQLTVESPDDVTAFADDEGVRTILNNLVDNAIKFTPVGGRVTVRAILTVARVAVEIEDSGIGIAEGELSRIFERFYCVDRARSRELGGTGLGLSIVKHFASAFGGAVSVKSELRRGSTFRVELPRGKRSVSQAQVTEGAAAFGDPLNDHAAERLTAPVGSRH